MPSVPTSPPIPVLPRAEALATAHGHVTAAMGVLDAHVDAGLVPVVHATAAGRDVLLATRVLQSSPGLVDTEPPIRGAVDALAGVYATLSTPPDTTGAEALQLHGRLAGIAATLDGGR